MAQWSFRLQQEESQSISAHFITLTYATHSIPFSRNGKLDLRKRDLQLFFKRLRKAHKRAARIQNNSGGKRNSRNKVQKFDYSKPIKYYAVGEYGGKYRRPHYHIILFNANIELIQPAWTNPETGKHIGNIFYGSVTSESVGYTLKYMSKNKNTYMSKNDDRQKEFALMSKGLGINYVNPRSIKYHHAKIDRTFVTLHGGVKVAMPRYYRDKIFNEKQKEEARQFFQQKHAERILNQFYNLSPAEFHRVHRDLQEAIKHSDIRIKKAAMKGKTQNF